MFPARDLSVDPRSGITRRHHVDPGVINKAPRVFQVHWMTSTFEGDHLNEKFTTILALTVNSSGDEEK